MIGEKAIRLVKDHGLYHVVNSTAVCVVATPAFTLFERLLGVDRHVSENARILALFVTYGGFGYVLSKGQDIWRKWFDVEQKGRKRLHDTLSITAMNLIASPVFYHFAEAHTIDDLLKGTIIATGMALAMGGIYGIARDVYQDLFHLPHGKRTPYRIRQSSLPVRWGLAMGIASLSLAATLGLYQGYPQREQAQRAPTAQVQYETIDTSIP